jgi:hypothetical protein
MGRALRRTEIFIVAVASALAMLAPAAASASASAGVCGLFSRAAFAKIVGLPHSSVEVGPASGGPLSVAACEFQAWRGSKPPAKQIATREQKGTVALLEISTITEALAGPQATWEHEALEIPEGIKNEFERFGFGPKVFTPPTFGADTSGGYNGSEALLRAVRGYWTSTSKRTAVLVTIFHADRKLAPVQAELVKAATSIVPAALDA